MGVVDMEITCGDFKALRRRNTHWDSGRVDKREKWPSSISYSQQGSFELLEEHRNNYIPGSRPTSCRAQGHGSPASYRYKGTREQRTRNRVIDLLDFWLAGSEGKKIFGAARKKLAEHRRKLHERRLPVLNPGF
jgi:hypothetical protein